MNRLLPFFQPSEYEGIPINTDFRNMVQVDLILKDSDIQENEKMVKALMLLYPDIPKDVEKACAGFIWFYSRGQAAEHGEGNPPKDKKQSFCFKQDADLIIAAFMAVYGIDLTAISNLHWWLFMALFEGLPSDTLIQKVRYCRTVETAKLTKAEKKYVKEMCRLYPLQQQEKQPLTLEELNQQTKERVARRFAQAEERKG